MPIKSKLTDSQIQEARNRHYQGESLRSLGLFYGIAHSNLKRLIDEDYKKIRDAQIETWRKENPDKVLQYKVKSNPEILIKRIEKAKRVLIEAGYKISE